MNTQMNRRRLGLLAAAALVLTPVAALAWAPPTVVANALSDGRRTDQEIARDAISKPAEVIAFAGIKPGQHVADLIIGTGYYTKIFSGLVGPKGKVWAWQPRPFALFAAAYAAPLTQLPPLYPNLTADGSEFRDFNPPAGLDVAFTNQNYHDLHLASFPRDTADKVNAAVFKALKPGGVYVVIDHYAKPGGDTTQVATGIHRIDPEVVKREVLAAGFVLDGSSDLLRNRADPLTANVFDDSIKGKTDQFMLRFKKPG